LGEGIFIGNINKEIRLSRSTKQKSNEIKVK